MPKKICITLNGRWSSFKMTDAKECGTVKAGRAEDPLLPSKETLLPREEIILVTFIFSPTLTGK